MRHLGIAALLLLMSACQLLDRGPDPQDAADELATALSQKSLERVAFDGTPPGDAFTTAIAELKDFPLEVTVGGVSEEDDRAAVTLDWSWDISGAPWGYETEATLVRRDDAWHAVWDPALVQPSLREGEHLELHRLQPRRGEILGADGAAIVTERDVVRLGLDKQKVGAAGWESSAREIARLLDVDVAAFLKKVTAAGPKAFVEAIVLRRSDAARLVPGAYAAVPGAVSLGTTRPLAPTREFAAPLLGTVGPVTAELVEKSEGRLRSGDIAGLSGLQARYDEQLTGTRGARIEAVDAQGKARVLTETAPVDGTPLQLTLDVDLQAKAERILADVGPASAIVAIRPSSGDILAAASGPGSKGLNTATAGQYAPGSTMKVVSALALLRSGLRPDSTVSCPPTVVVDGKTFKNYDDYPAGSLGDITLREAVAQSCNTAIIGQRDRLEGSALSDAAAALGLGVDHDLGFPAYFGQVPPPASKTEAAADLIGQGKVLASPMTMAAVAASVSAGQAVLPRLVVGPPVTQVPPAAPLTEQEATQLRTLMRAVVTDGSGRFLADLPGGVGAKTGTAEYGEARGGSLPTHAWMIATRGDLAVAVFVATGESGSRTAGPLLEEFLR